jgi:hypothetical protein
MEFQTKTCQEGAPEDVLDSGRGLKVFEHLGGEYCTEEEIEKIEHL